MIDLYEGWICTSGRITKDTDFANDEVINFKGISMDEVVALRRKYPGCETTIIQIPNSRSKGSREKTDHFSRYSNKTAVKPPANITPAVKPAVLKETAGDYSDLVNKMSGANS